MKNNQEAQNKSNVLEEINLLTQKVQELQVRCGKEAQDFSKVLEICKARFHKTSRELQSIRQTLELLKTHTEVESESKSNRKDSQKEFHNYLNSLTNYSFNPKRDVWLCPPLLTEEDKIPRFIPVSERSKNSARPGTRFVSFINFKGGVGKTTLTANLAAAFSSGNYRINNAEIAVRPLKVLVVDLDFQGTLSDRCAEYNRLVEAIDQKKLSSELLTNPKFSRYTLDELTLKFEVNENAFIIPSFDSLDAADNEQFVRFATRRRDVRYSYRQWFHSTKIFDAYDLVIFDCPPRKTASSICALMASDLVFVPTAPEPLDELSLTRSTHWLISFKMKMDAPYVIGGFILNRTQDKSKLSSSEINFREKVLHTLKMRSSNEERERYITQYGFPSFLNTFIPKRTGNKSINGQRGEPIPGASRNRQEFPFFTDLASEMYERIYQ